MRCKYIESFQDVLCGLSQLYYLSRASLMSQVPRTCSNCTDKVVNSVLQLKTYFFVPLLSLYTFSLIGNFLPHK